MTLGPASGERDALRGYRWQYDHIATRVYDALLDGDFVSLRLTDPNAGRVDDLILIRSGRTDGYQFKSVKFPRYLTFNQVLRSQRTRGGSDAPCFVRSLAEGWESLRSRWTNAHVHLVTDRLASVNDHLGAPGARPSPDHFRAFLTNVLVPIRRKLITLDSIQLVWQHALTRLHKASGISESEFERFLQSLHFEVGAGSGLPASASSRRSDIESLSDSLMRQVSEANDVVDLNERDVVELMGWQNRTRLRSRHKFPIDLDTYEPLTAAIEELNDVIARSKSGYVAVIGPPGAGKSTLLSQALTGSTDRILRYYAYVPATTLARTRQSARGFLHDIHIMLKKSGISASEQELPSSDVVELRDQVSKQLDAAGAEFQRTGRRTIIVVDGLDHVERHYSSSDGLLAELPRPDELPDGVLFLVGSRTLAPLNAYASQQLNERQATIDLQHHRLSPASVLKICGHAAITANLSNAVHMRIVELCNGHPLALSYLFNRLREAGSKSAEEVFATAPAYGGDVAAEYLAVWDDIEDDNIVDLLGVCARLRVAFTTEWLYGWAPQAAVRTFQSKLLYLFRREHGGWQFFHDSFRQFAVDRTALGDDARPDKHIERRAHRRVANLCRESTDRRFATEELHHRYCAGQYDEVLTLSEQAKFREQYRQLRSADLIREDIGLALRVAADRADVMAMFRLLLALAEVTQRTSALENVDMPGLLNRAGLTHQAIAWCGADVPRVPLAQAFDMAARLGRADDPAGRVMFDRIEHYGIDDPNRPLVAGHEDDAALAWTRAAALFRPLSVVIPVIGNLVENSLKDDQRNRYEQAKRQQRFRLMFQELIFELRNQEPSLRMIDSALDDIAARVKRGRSQQEQGDSDERVEATRKNTLATAAELRVHTHLALIELGKTDEVKERRVTKLLSMLVGVPLFVSTILEAAESLADHGFGENAALLLDGTPYGNALTVRTLNEPRDTKLIERHFRYWRVRYLLASGDAEVPKSIQPATETPGGNNVPPHAAIHGDVEAIELAAKIDEAVRTLGSVDAALALEQSVPRGEIWAALVPLLDIFSAPARRSSSSFSLIASQKPRLIRIIASVARRCGRETTERLRDELARRFEEEPDRWTLGLRLDLGEYFRSAGVSAPWYEHSLLALEANAASENLYSRLASMEDLVCRYAENGQLAVARRLVQRLISMAFSVGFRNDNQFDYWVTSLGRALAQPGGSRFVDEAAWLARVLTAAEPMTEGAPGVAAEDLPAAVVSVAPMASIRIFEYLVRHGTVHHLGTLAGLVRALVIHEEVDNMAIVQVAADITGELIAPAANRAYPELTASLLSAAKKAGNHADAAMLAQSVASRTDRYALPTSRKFWRKGLGLVHSAEEKDTDESVRSSEDEYDSLKLSNGQRIARRDVASHIGSIDDLVNLRRMEVRDSLFDWSAVVDEQHFTNEDVQALVGTFDDGSTRGAQVLVSLAAAAESNGDGPTALRVASKALERLRGDSWSRYFGGWCQRAAAIAVRLGGRDSRVTACRNLARQVAENRWLPALLVLEFAEIVEALESKLDAETAWREIRIYLDGMAETLDLPDNNVLIDHDCRWWCLVPSRDRRETAKETSPALALADLTVGHLSHPTWLVRGAATMIIIRALKGGIKEFGNALRRFALAGSSDDTLERAGRCLAAARSGSGYCVTGDIQRLERVLERHPNQIVRDLAANPSPSDYRALSPIYHFSLPQPTQGEINSNRVFLSPHEWQYEMLATHLNFNYETLLAVAAQYASRMAAMLPSPESVKEALTRKQVQHIYPSEKITAARAAFGRVLADLKDARLLENISPMVGRLLRTVDVELLSRAPESRPSVVPAPPPAGIDQSVSQWCEGIENRLGSYVESSIEKDRVLIGARCRLTVLNWGHLEERLVCGTTVGTGEPLGGRMLVRRESRRLSDLVSESDCAWPEDKEPLVMENMGETFHQIHADWLSFRPELATSLGWTPDSNRPGCWFTESGELAVESIWWVDGWWGRVGPAFDDTEAEGHAVALTLCGLLDVSKAFGPISRHFELTRRGRDDGVEVDPVSARQTILVAVPSV